MSPRCVGRLPAAPPPPLLLLLAAAAIAFQHAAASPLDNDSCSRRMLLPPSQLPRLLPPLPSQLPRQTVAAPLPAARAPRTESFSTARPRYAPQNMQRASVWQACARSQGAAWHGTAEGIAHIGGGHTQAALGEALLSSGQALGSQVLAWATGLGPLQAPSCKVGNPS